MGRPTWSCCILGQRLGPSQIDAWHVLTLRQPTGGRRYRVVVAVGQSSGAVAWVRAENRMGDRGKGKQPKECAARQFTRGIVRMLFWDALRIPRVHQLVERRRSNSARRS